MPKSIRQMFISLFSLSIALFFVPGLGACSYSPPTDAPPPTGQGDFDEPDTFDIYVDDTGPNGFYAQVEHESFYTSREAYEAASPDIFNEAQQRGQPIRMVVGTDLRSQGQMQTLDFKPTLEMFGYMLKFGPPEKKYIAGCISTIALSSNVWLHKIINGRGTQLLDLHIAAFKRPNQSNVCFGLYESEQNLVNFCTCAPGGIFQDLQNARSSLAASFQREGMQQSQATILAGAAAPLMYLMLAPAAL